VRINPEAIDCSELQNRPPEEWERDRPVSDPTRRWFQGSVAKLQPLFVSRVSSDTKTITLTTENTGIRLRPTTRAPRIPFGGRRLDGRR
jgi:hypothetical protein